MLAPPAMRTGVGKPNVRSRIADKPLNDEGTSDGAGNEMVQHTTSIQVQPSSETELSRPAAANSSPSSNKRQLQQQQPQTPTPLHLRMVSDVDFLVYPFSLIFLDPACEVDYLKCLSDRVPGYVRRVSAWMMIVVTIALGIEGGCMGRASSAYSDAPSSYTIDPSSTSSPYAIRLFLLGTTWLMCGVICCFAPRIIRRSRLPVFTPFNQALLTFLFCAIGVLWVLGLSFNQDALVSERFEMASSSSSPAVAFLLWMVIFHSCARFMFFPTTVLVTLLSLIAFLVSSVVFAPNLATSQELAWSGTSVVGGAGLRLGWECAIATIGCIITCYIGYRFDFLRRSNHINQLKVELGRREKADLKKEAFDLRDEMYVMTLERYDIADVDRSHAIEFKSPMEQAMAKLQALSDNKNLPKDAFVEVQKVIGLLGNSSDVFKVQVSSQLARENIQLDDETTRYLFDLVNDGILDGEDNNTTATSPAADGNEPGNSSGNATRAASPRLMMANNNNNQSGGDGTTSNSVSVAPSDRDLSSDASGQAVSQVGSSGGSSTAAAGGGGVLLTPLERSSTASKFTTPAGLLAKEEKQINDLLKAMDQPNFDVFEVANLTGGKPLFFVGTALFKKYHLINKFGIDRTKLSNFLNSVENGYLRSNPYHNAIHASDVARTVHYFIHTTPVKAYSTDLEILGLIVASLVHDYDHPGKTNQFHIAIRDQKALLYNDRSVLENHHVAQCFFLLNREENNIFANFSQKDYAQVRKWIIELVLATDLGAHFDFLAQFKSAVSSGALDTSTAASRLMVHKMALKCGDLGHSTKPLVLHEKWTARITEEFYRQGDEERKRHLPISPFMDRQKANLPQSQVGFLDFLVIPLFSTWIKFMELDEATDPLMVQLRANKEHWKNQLVGETHSNHNHQTKKNSSPNNANTVQHDQTTNSMMTPTNRGNNTNANPNPSTLPSPSASSPATATAAAATSEHTTDVEVISIDKDDGKEEKDDQTKDRKLSHGSNKVAPAPLE